MEDVKKFKQNEGNLMSSSDEISDSDSFSDFYPRNKNLFSANILERKKYILTSKKRNGGRRLPTRRPDPNVYNRNALLARENRRKKKEYLEMIEKEVEVLRKTNHTLVKALKRQVKITKRLETERKNFQHFVNAFNLHRLPECEKSSFSARSNCEQYVYSQMDGRPPTRGVRSVYDSNSLSTESDSPSNGSVTVPVESSLKDLSPFVFSSFPDFFAELDNGAGNSIATTSTNLDNMWDDNDYNIDHLISTHFSVEQSFHDLQSFENDHCYIATSTYCSNQATNKINEPSCLDASGYSTDMDQYCSNWKSFCHTPPLQLLNEESS